MKDLKIKKCMNCGATVEIIEDCNCDDCGIQCCGEKMKELVPNSIDASAEKHVPTYEIKENNGEIHVKVNHVMDEDHYIECIGICYDNRIGKVFFKPGEKPEADFKYVKGAILYTLCNRHGLWSTKVK